MCYVAPLFGQSNLMWSSKIYHPEAIHTAGYYHGIVLDNNGDACVVGEAFNGVNNSLVVGKVSVDGEVIWTKIFDYDSQLKRSIKGGIGVDAQNNIYITGHQIKSSENSNDISDLFLMKISSSGELLWTKIYNSGFNDKMDFNGILVRPSGEVIIAAMQYNTLNPNYNDLLFVKYSADGSLVWEKNVDGGNYEFLRSVTMDANENIYAAFQIYNYNEVSPNSIGAAKLNSSGDLQWYKVFPWEKTKFLFSNINDLAVNEQGEVFIIGHMNTPVNNDFDLLTVKYDGNGNLLWSQIFNSGSTDYCASIVPDKNGSVVVTSNSFDPSISGYYSNVIKYNSIGELQWQSPVFKSNVMGSFSWNYDMTTDGESNYFLVGFSYINGKLMAKSAQLNQDGKVEWTEDFLDDGSSFVYGYDIVTDGAKAVYVFGTSQRPSAKIKTELYVAKYPIVKKFVDVTPPTAIAKNISVTLVEGIAQISADQINDGSSDASGIDTMFISTSSFSCSTIGDNKVVLTVIDVFGNVANDTSVVTVLGAVPAVSILQGEQTKYCQGGAIVLTANSNTATAYNWNDGDVSKCKSVYASGNYSLTVSNKYGCTAMASTNVVYNPSNLLSA